MRRSPRTHGLAACLAICTALLAAPFAGADVGVEAEGRSTRTGPKQIQSEFNGRPVEAPAVERPSGRTLGPAGRKLRSEPTQRVSVGIIGCPGCTAALGGVIVDARDPGTRSER